MADEYALIIAKAGYNYTDPDIRNLMFHSDKAMLKESSVVSGYVDFSPGDSYKELVIPHGLGYTPWFIPYMRNNSTAQEEILPVIPTGIEGPAFSAYADNTNIVFKADLYFGYNEALYSVNSYYTNSGTYLKAQVGEDGGGKDCMIYFDLDWFSPIEIVKYDTIDSATIDFWISQKGSSGDTKIKTWGIDIDDASGGADSDLGKAKTTAEGSQNVAAGAGSYFGINVKTQVQEIVNRSGWVKNSFGFYIFNDSSPSGVYVQDSNWNSFLTIRKSGTLRLYFKAVIFVDKIL